MWFDWLDHKTQFGPSLNLYLMLLIWINLYESETFFWMNNLFWVNYPFNIGYTWYVIHK